MLTPQQKEYRNELRDLCKKNGYSKDTYISTFVLVMGEPTTPKKQELMWKKAIELARQSLPERAYNVQMSRYLFYLNDDDWLEKGLDKKDKEFKLW